MDTFWKVTSFRPDDTMFQAPDTDQLPRTTTAHTVLYMFDDGSGLFYTRINSEESS